MKKTSLSDFAKATPPNHGGVACWVCNIPEADEINAAYSNGTQAGIIQDWLIEHCGYDPGTATQAKIKGHFQNGKHHLKTHPKRNSK